MNLSQPSAPGATPLAGQIAAALGWWREAGVDCHFADEAQHWLAAPEADVAETARPAAAMLAPQAPPPPPKVRLGGDATSWPDGLDNFFSWWLEEPSLDGGITEGRVPPRGPRRASLMILVDHPEAQDSDRLLAGPAGKLAAAVARAIGLEESDLYWASALPRHMPLPDWAALAEAGLGQVLAHHIALAAPKRLLVFSPHVSSLLGHDPTKTAEPLQRFNHEGASIPALVAPALSLLATQPKRKARLWRALQEWMGTD